jgi:N6-adenosine-specific RNA methylase IME4
MTTTAQMRGHPVYWDGAVWRYADDGSLAPASGGAERPCTACGRTAQGDYGPDPCLGCIEGSTGACCGHAFRTIVADPPWPQKHGGPLRGREGFVDTAGSLPMPYSTMSVEAIKALLDTADIGVANDAHLYLWTTSRFLEDAYRVVRAWGFTYSTTLVWAKAPIGAGLGGAYGIATEFVLFARRGVLPTTDRIGRNWFTWKRPYDERGKPRHSAKPPEFFEMVERVSPGPRLEMFARGPRVGWDVWGDEAVA